MTTSTRVTGQCFAFRAYDENFYSAIVDRVNNDIVTILYFVPESAEKLYTAHLDDEDFNDRCFPL